MSNTIRTMTSSVTLDLKGAVVVQRATHTSTVIIENFGKIAKTNLGQIDSAEIASSEVTDPFEINFTITPSSNTASIESIIVSHHSGIKAIPSSGFLSPVLEPVTNVTSSTTSSIPHSTELIALPTEKKLPTLRVSASPVPPTIKGVVSTAQAVTDAATVTPFKTVSIEDTNVAQTETVKITLSSPTNGSLTNLGTGSYDAATGVFTVSGIASAVTKVIDALVFVPKAHQVIPGNTVATSFKLEVTDTANLTAVNTAVNVTATAVASPLKITGTKTGQAVTDLTTLSPFAAVSIVDSNFSQTQTVTIQLSSANNGTLGNLLNGGTYDAGAGRYSITGTADVVNSAIDALVFTPKAHQVAPKSTVTTTFTITDTDSARATISSSASTVIATAVAVAPNISGATSLQAVTDATTITPFSSVVFSDLNAGQNETVTVTLSSAANGALSNVGIGSYTATTGVYTVTGSMAAVTSAVNGLVFTPTAHQVAPGAKVTTTFTVQVTDTAKASQLDSNTSVITTAVAATPTITGAKIAQAVTDASSITPFKTMVIGDVNVAQNQTVTLTISSIANGTLGNLGIGSYNSVNGIYTVSGTAPAVTSAIQGLIFTPTPHQVFPGTTVTTTFLVQDTDTANASTSNNITSVIATAIALPPSITGAKGGQTTTDATSITPFKSVVIGDLNYSQTETVTISLSSASNGTLSFSGVGNYNSNSGVYTVTGSADAVTSAIQNLTFIPTPHQVAPGSTVTTTFTISDTNSAKVTATNIAVTVLSTAVVSVPVITGAMTSLGVTDATTITPFASVVISDPNFSQTETVTVALSKAANGIFTNLGVGNYNPVSGVYTVTGSPAIVTKTINGLVFVPTAHQVAPGSLVTTKFTIRDIDTAKATAQPVTCDVISTAVASLPTITGVKSSQAVTDATSITPFKTVVIGDDNVAQTETVRITVSNLANGSLSNFGVGSYDSVSGVYTVSGSASAVTSSVAGLIFTPTAHQVAPGSTVSTSFTIVDTDTANATLTNSASSVISTAVAVVPTLTGAISGQVVTDADTLMPFKTVVIGDLNASQTEYVTIKLSSAANGVLIPSGSGAGTYDPVAGQYTVSGSTAAVNTAIESLVFRPTAHQVAPLSTILTTFTIVDTDTAQAKVTNTTTTVTTKAVAVAPTITGAAAAQRVNDNNTITPFSAVVIGDLNASQTETATITISSVANGVLSNLGAGSYNSTTGVYTVTGSAAGVTTAIRGLVFTPTAHQVAPTSSVTTAFTITDTDSANATVTDKSTTVIATAVAVPPSITGAQAAQAVADSSSLTPFASVVIADLNAAQTETVTIQLSAPANGVLSNLGLGTYDPVAGLYTLTGSAAAVTSTIERLVFKPTVHQVSPGTTVTTTFTIVDTDTALATITNSVSSVIASAVGTAPVVSGAKSAQATTDAATSFQPFASVVITDPNFEQLETVTITLSSPLNGSLSSLGSGSYDPVVGVFTVSGNASAVTTAIQGLVFIPTAHQVAPKSTVTTTFTITDTDTSKLSTTNTLTSVVTTAAVAPITITGVSASQTIDDSATTNPFTTLVIGDPNAGQTETAVITLSNVANGILSNLGGGKYNSITGVYTVTGSASAVSAAIEGLVFTPTAHQVAPGSSIITTFTVVDTDTANATVSDQTTKVTATAVAVLPTVKGAQAEQAVTDAGSIAPFKSVLIGDLNLGQTQSITITMSEPGNGVLSHLDGLNASYDATLGVYTVSGSANEVTTAINGLIFTPKAHLVVPGSSTKTSFILVDQDTANQQVTNSVTSVIATAVASLPTLTGATVAIQNVFDNSSIHPFSNVVIADANVGQLQTVTITLSNANDGTLSSNGIGQYNRGLGVFSVTGNAEDVTAAIRAVTFTPTSHLVSPGSSFTTTFTIQDIDSAKASITSNVTKVVTTGVVEPPTISGVVATQSVTDASSIKPFASVLISDMNAGQTETVTITMSNSANGMLSNLGAGSYNSNTGVYTVAGSAAAVTSSIDNLIFTPTAHQVAPAQSVVTVFTIRDTNTATATAVASPDTTVTATALAVLPTLIGVQAAQPVTDASSVKPFKTVVISDANAAQTETVKITLSAAINGLLIPSGPNSGSYDSVAGVYTVTGLPSEVTTAIENLVFVPTAHQIAPGLTITTNFAIQVTNSALVLASNNSTSVISTAVASPPTITGASAGQPINDNNTITPFSAVVIGDLNASQTETATITISSVANGVLSNLGAGSYNSTTGVYTVTGSAAGVTTAIRGLVFTPTAHQVAPTSSVTTAFTITDTDSANATVTDKSTTVIATAVAVPPSITGAQAAQAVADSSSLTPFASVVIADLNAAQTETVTIQLSAPANGVLSNLGLGTYDPVAGLYTLTGSAAAVTSTIERLVFKPTVHQVSPGTTVTTTFTIVDTDTALATITNSVSSVIASAVGTAPVVSGAKSAQATTDAATSFQPFASVVITDPNFEQLETVTITLSSPLNGSLSSLGSGSYDPVVGVFTVSGNASAVTTAIQGLVFIPTAHQVAPKSTVTTTFTITDTDTSKLSTTNTLTSVVTTAAVAPITITGVSASQTIDDSATTNPFTTLVIGDANLEQTEAVTITLSNPNNGVLSNLAGGTYNSITGVYTVKGTATAVTSALQGLVFTPTAHQVTPGQATTTTFTVVDTNTAKAMVSNQGTTVTATAVPVLPTVSGVQAGQEITDASSIAPFKTWVITDANVGQTEDITITFNAANGVLSNLGGLNASFSSGVYHVSGSANAVTNAIQGIVFTPTPHLVAPGSSTKTTFTLVDTDTANMVLTNSVTSVISTAIASAPTLTGVQGSQPTTDALTIRPFQSVVLSDPNLGQTETLTITLSSINNGVLSNLSGGNYDPSTGVYTVTGSASVVTSAIQGLIFIPTAHQTSPGLSITTKFSIQDTDSALATTSNNSTSVVVSAVAVQPTITGAVSAQTTDAISLTPFSSVVISDPNLGQTQTVTVTLSKANNGQLSNLGIGSYSSKTGVYTVSGSDSAVTTAIEGLVFTPTAHQVAPGGSVTTTFTISDIDTALQMVSNNTTVVNSIAVAAQPMINGTVANQEVSDVTSIKPFSTVVIVDPNLAQVENVTIALSAVGNGVLSNLGSGSYNSSNGLYTFTGSAASVTSMIQGLVFTPTPHQVSPGMSVSTVFTISDTDTSLATVSNNTVSVLSRAVLSQPTITGTVAAQAVTDATSVRPFGSVVITDANFGQIETVTITMTPTVNGVLSNLGGGIYDSGVYTISGSAADVTAAIEGLVFTPAAHQVIPGQTVSTSFAISDTDSANQTVTNNSSHVIATAVASTPIIRGALSAQAVSDDATIRPFASLFITDPNLSQEETVTITLSSPGNGALTNTGSLGIYEPTSGVFTITGSAAVVTSVIKGLVFVPKAHLVAPGETFTTTFMIQDTDSASAVAVNNTSSVITTATAQLPTISYTDSVQPLNDDETIKPFEFVVIGDPNINQTETVTIALSAPLNGILSQLGGGSYDKALGLYTVSGSAASVTTAIQGLVFTPTAHQVAPVQTMTTVFTIQDRDTAKAVVIDNTTSVTVTAIATVPTITGTMASQPVNDNSTLHPFASVMIADLNADQTETVTITLDHPENGVLGSFGSGSYDASTGVYSITGSATAVNSAIHDLLFTPTPHQVAPISPISTVTTTFTIVDSDSINARVESSNTTVIATAVASNPTITGVKVSQLVNDSTTLAPFSKVVIVDPNVGQTETVTITLSNPSNGVLSNLSGGATYSSSSGIYTVSGTAAAVNAAISALIFIPTPHQVAPGSIVTSTFILQDTTSVNTSITSPTITVNSMAIAVQSSISGAMSSQPVTDAGTVHPFSSVVISDLNFNPTDTVKITSSAPSNGVLSPVNGVGSYDTQTGVYTYTGNPADVTAAIQALVFTPTLHQVSPGSTVTTTFEIEDSNTAQIVIVADTSTSVITTAV